MVAQVHDKISGPGGLKERYKEAVQARFADKLKRLKADLQQNKVSQADYDSRARRYRDLSVLDPFEAVDESEALEGDEELEQKIYNKYYLAGVHTLFGVLCSAAVLSLC